MSNVLKGFWLSVNEDSKVVDTNELVERRIQEEQERIAKLQTIANISYDSDEFFEGLPAENIDDLIDSDAEEAVQKSAEREELERINEELSAARVGIEEARAEASVILENARAEAEQIKADAFEEGKSEGFEAGQAEADRQLKAKMDELEEKEESLEKQYAELAEQLEPLLVEKITDVFEHIFKINLEEYKGIVSGLIVDALNNSNGARNVIIHISREDFQSVVEKKEDILAQTGLTEHSAEFIQDGVLSPGGCLIETENGVFDCSVDTYLQELIRKLKIISYSV